ncbi:VOC family protein [Actinomyces sp. Marseille-P3109]|uniref:VOC family protein n=1 Tax=Actinomyces sp. Marseille-P3109 TaxID=2083009 RepID=UPI000D550627|nr:VOC family protein [Actinomyces sp. Marseille-P3109]
MRTEPVFTPNSVILYVSDVKASTGFYRKILGSGPVETYPGFSVFSLSDGMTLGLQAADQIEPAAEPYIGGGELSLSNVESADVVDRLYAQWKALGISMVLEPTTLEFGYTFVAADPDGHRLRVCATDTSRFN